MHKYSLRLIRNLNCKYKSDYSQNVRIPTQPDIQTIGENPLQIRPTKSQKCRTKREISGKPPSARFGNGANKRPLPKNVLINNPPGEDLLLSYLVEIYIRVLFLAVLITNNGRIGLPLDTMDRHMYREGGLPRPFDVNGNSKTFPDIPQENALQSMYNEYSDNLSSSDEC